MTRISEKFLERCILTNFASNNRKGSKRSPENRFYGRRFFRQKITFEWIEKMLKLMMLRLLTLTLTLRIKLTLTITLTRFNRLK